MVLVILTINSNSPSTYKWLLICWWSESQRSCLVVNSDPCQPGRWFKNWVSRSSSTVSSVLIWLLELSCVVGRKLILGWGNANCDLCQLHIWLEMYAGYGANCIEWPPIECAHGSNIWTDYCSCQLWLNWLKGESKKVYALRQVSGLRLA